MFVFGSMIICQTPVDCRSDSRSLYDRSGEYRWSEKRYNVKPQSCSNFLLVVLCIITEATDYLGAYPALHVVVTFEGPKQARGESKNGIE